MAQLRDDWVYTTRIHSTDAAFSKRSCNAMTSVHLWTDKTQNAKAAALFSRFAIPQSMKNNSRSKNLSGVDYSDPAFSPDPLSNPNFFSSEQSPAGATPPGSRNPTAKKQRPRAKDYIPPPPPNSPALPEPATTDISTASSTINSPSFTTSSYSSPRPHPAAPPVSSDPPTSPEPHVHAKADMPQDATLLRRHSHHSILPSKPEHKKPNGFLSKIFGLSSSEPSESATTSSSSSPPPPPKNRRRSSMQLVPQSPPLPQNRSPLAQSVHQPRIANLSPETSASVMENPQRQTRTRAAGETTRVTPTVAVPPPVDDQRMHQDLDRIDEMDESSPFGGVMMHNGGPYEAISRFVHTESNSKPHAKPTRAQQNSGQGKFMMSGDIYRNAQIIALQKGSLNLKPGQVLPHNLVPRVEVFHHPYPQPNFQPHHDKHHDHHSLHTYPEPGVPIHDSRSSLEQPGPIPINPSLPHATHPGSQSNSSIPDLSSDRRRRTPSPTPTVIQYDNQDSGFAIGMAMISPDENTPHPTNVTTVVEHSSEIGLSTSRVAPNKPSIDKSRPSPPPYTFEPPNPLSDETRYMRTNDSHAQGVAITPNNRGQVFNMHETTQLPTRMPSASSLSRSGTWQPQPVQTSPPQPHSGPSRREVYSLEPPPPQERVTPPDPRLNRTSTYVISPSGAHTDRLVLASSLQRGESIPRSSDARSVQQSLVTTSNASRMTGSTQTREDYRRNRYLPKHLVMPTPLQPTLQNRAAVEQVRLDPRDPSPSKRRSALVTSPIPRAENVPVAPSGGKLRKRMSLLGGKKEQASSVAAVSFLANIVTSDKNGSGAEKQRKNVLNRRK